MKKRIGTKLYDTETSELVCGIDGGTLFRKRSRDREWFAVLDDGTVRPLDVYDPLDVLLMETGKLPEGALDDPDLVSDKIRVDAETYQRIHAAARSAGVSMGRIIREALDAAGM